MLQLLKASLQATELFSDRNPKLPELAHDFLMQKFELSKQPGSPVSLLESLINTLCSGAAFSTAHAYKIAFILCVCVAHHEEWKLASELSKKQGLPRKVSGVLEAALGQKQAASAQNQPQSYRLADQAQPIKTPAAGLPLQLPARRKAVENLPALVKGRSKQSQEAAGAELADVDAEVARASAEAYLERVRAGMAADKAPAVAVRSLPVRTLPFLGC